MKTRVYALVLAMGLAVMFAGCGGGGGGGSSDGPVADIVSRLFKALEPGSMSVPSLKAAVSVPSGALAVDTTLTIAASGSVPSATGLVPGTAYDFGPTGTTFSSPATITIRYNPTMLGSIREATLRIVKLVSGSWKTVPGSHLDMADHLVMAPVSSFSTYAIMGDAVDGPVTVRLMVPGDVYNYHTTTTIASSTTETDEEFKVSTETGKTPTFGTRRFLIGPDDWRFEQADNGTVYLLGERSEEVTSSTGPPVFIPSPIAVGQTFSYTLVLQNTDLTNVYTDTKQVVVTVSGVDEIDGATHYVVDYNYNTSRVFATGEVDFGGTMHFKVNPLVGLFTLMEETKEQSGDNLYTKSRQLTSKSF